MVRIVNGEVCSIGPDGLPVSRRGSMSGVGTPVPATSLGALQQQGPMPPLSLASTPALTPALSPNSPMTASGRSTPMQSGSGHPTPLRSAFPPLRDRSANHTPIQRLSPAVHATYDGSAFSPPPLALGSHSAQYTNPYLSHTSFGSSAVTSGEGFNQEAYHQHAAAFNYYPYALHGFLGPGFILGHASPPPQHQPQQSPQPDTHVHSTQQPTPTGDPASAPQHYPHPPLQHASLPSSSAPSPSCPSPLLTSTSERRRSKPHNQFVPPTHSVLPNGLVLPIVPPPPAVAPAQQPHPPSQSTSARVSHAFNLFGLPPVYIYEIRVPPHVYLLTALVLYGIGPPALIPLVACFFFYRWHLQQQQHAQMHGAPQSSRGGPHIPVVQPAEKPVPAGGSMGGLLGGLNKPPPHPVPSGSSGGGLPPKAHPSPLAQPQRRHPNIHSLSDL